MLYHFRSGVNTMMLTRVSSSSIIIIQEVIREMINQSTDFIIKCQMLVKLFLLMIPQNYW